MAWCHKLKKKNVILKVLLLFINNLHEPGPASGFSLFKEGLLPQLLVWGIGLKLNSTFIFLTYFFFPRFFAAAELVAVKVRLQLSVELQRVGVEAEMMEEPLEESDSKMCRFDKNVCRM